MINNLIIHGPIGNLETIYHGDMNVEPEICVIICHPNPEQKGTMNNKVVTTCAKACLALGFHAIRFNYRGVGKSEGFFGDAIGEIDDCSAVIEWVKTKYPKIKIWLAGFSFGAYIAAKCSVLTNIEQLICIAPVTTKRDFNLITNFNCPVFIIIGTNDELCSIQNIEVWVKNITTAKKLLIIENASHFFHGKLIELQKEIEKQYIDLL